jgi:hypothetical protein
MRKEKNTANCEYSAICFALILKSFFLKIIINAIKGIGSIGLIEYIESMKSVRNILFIKKRKKHPVTAKNNNIAL